MSFGGLLKQSTAVDVLIGPFLDEDDGKTAETGLTLSQGDIKLSKNGQALAQKNDATAASHDANGYYNCELDATDTNTCGQLTLIVHETGALPVRHEYHVIEEDVYDALFAASAAAFDSNQRVDVGSWLGSAVTKSTGDLPDVNVAEVSDDSAAADNLESACDNYSVTRGLAGTALPDAAADGAGGLPISDAGELDLDGMNTNISNILVDTQEIGAAGAGLTAVPWNAAWDAEVESECNDALVQLGLDHLVAVADADDVADNSIIAKMAASDGDWSGFSSADDSLEAIRDRGDGAWGGSSSDILITSGTVGATSTALNFHTDLTAADNIYDGLLLLMTSGTYEDEARFIEDYANTNGVVTLTESLGGAPAENDTFKILAFRRET